MTDIVNSDFGDIVKQGTDVKLLSYDYNAIDICEDIINLRDIMQNTFQFDNKILNDNCILINIEKDYQRYLNSIEEFKKLSIINFVHLKATYWKQREQFVIDLNFILDFLKQFNSTIDNTSQTTINLFSEVSNSNIYIQDGPLACYCSHLRAMIYGYLNFKNYTIIVEDDISIKNTANIDKYLKCIPNDWDVVLFGAIPKNIEYTTPYYRFMDEFHSTHFYIINHKCLPFLFSKLYPITDQVDVLISNQFKNLNIYNIPNTMYQRDISTNTQNNLHTILHSPHYSVIRQQINIIRKNLLDFLNTQLINNDQNNNDICNILMYDIIYHHICSIPNPNNKEITNTHQQFNNFDEINNNTILKNLYNSIFFFLKCTEKGNNTSDMTLGLLNNIINTIREFNLHDKQYSNSAYTLRAYRYGSTAKTYIIKYINIVVKVYEKYSRWNIKDHCNIDDIFNKELNILKITAKIPNAIKLIDYDIDKKMLVLTYGGTSLYDNFVLPINWKTQLRHIFIYLNLYNIYYPEFNIKNILNFDHQLFLTDFGLASINTIDNTIDNTKNNKNNDNYDIFVELLDILNDRLSKEPDIIFRQLLYTQFINNIKIHKITKYLNNIF